MNEELQRKAAERPVDPRRRPFHHRKPDPKLWLDGPTVIFTRDDPNFADFGDATLRRNAGETVSRFEARVAAHVSALREEREAAGLPGIDRVTFGQVL
jgi:hypothetical protein